MESFFDAEGLKAGEELGNDYCDRRLTFSHQNQGNPTDLSFGLSSIISNTSSGGHTSSGYADSSFADERDELTPTGRQNIPDTCVVKRSKTSILRQKLRLTRVSSRNRSANSIGLGSKPRFRASLVTSDQVCRTGYAQKSSHAHRSPPRCTTDEECVDFYIEKYLPFQHSQQKCRSSIRKPKVDNFISGKENVKGYKSDKRTRGRDQIEVCSELETEKAKYKRRPLSASECRKVGKAKHVGRREARGDYQDGKSRRRRWRADHVSDEYLAKLDACLVSKPCQMNRKNRSWSEPRCSSTSKTFKAIIDEVVSCQGASSQFVNKLWGRGKHDGIAVESSLVGHKESKTRAMHPAAYKKRSKSTSVRRETLLTKSRDCSSEPCPRPTIVPLSGVSAHSRQRARRRYKRSEFRYPPRRGVRLCKTPTVADFELPTPTIASLLRSQLCQMSQPASRNGQSARGTVTVGKTSARGRRQQKGQEQTQRGSLTDRMDMPGRGAGRNSDFVNSSGGSNKAKANPSRELVNHVYILKSLPEDITPSETETVMKSVKSICQKRICSADRCTRPFAFHRSFNRRHRSNQTVKPGWEHDVTSEPNLGSTSRPGRAITPVDRSRKESNRRGCARLKSKSPTESDRNCHSRKAGVQSSTSCCTDRGVPAVRKFGVEGEPRPAKENTEHMAGAEMRCKQGGCSCRSWNKHSVKQSDQKTSVGIQHVEVLEKKITSNEPPDDSLTSMKDVSLQTSLVSTNNVEGGKAWSLSPSQIMHESGVSVSNSSHPVTIPGGQSPVNGRGCSERKNAVSDRAGIESKDKCVWKNGNTFLTSAAYGTPRAVRAVRAAQRTQTHEGGLGETPQYKGWQVAGSGNGVAASSGHWCPLDQTHAAISVRTPPGVVGSAFLPPCPHEKAEDVISVNLNDERHEILQILSDSSSGGTYNVQTSLKDRDKTRTNNPTVRDKSDPVMAVTVPGVPVDNSARGGAGTCAGGADVSSDWFSSLHTEVNLGDLSGLSTGTAHTDTSVTLRLADLRPLTELDSSFSNASTADSAVRECSIGERIVQTADDRARRELKCPCAPCSRVGEDRSDGLTGRTTVHADVLVGLTSVSSTNLETIDGRTMRTNCSENAVHCNILKSPNVSPFFGTLDFESTPKADKNSIHGEKKKNHSVFQGKYFHERTGKPNVPNVPQVWKEHNSEMKCSKKVSSSWETGKGWSPSLSSRLDEDTATDGLSRATSKFSTRTCLSENRQTSCGSQSSAHVSVCLTGQGTSVSHKTVHDKAIVLLHSLSPLHPADVNTVYSIPNTTQNETSSATSNSQSSRRCSTTENCNVQAQSLSRSNHENPTPRVENTAGSNNSREGKPEVTELKKSGSNNLDKANRPSPQFNVTKAHRNICPDSAVTAAGSPSGSSRHIRPSLGLTTDDKFSVEGGVSPLPHQRPVVMKTYASTSDTPVQVELLKPWQASDGEKTSPHSGPQRLQSGRSTRRRSHGNSGHCCFTKGGGEPKSGQLSSGPGGGGRGSHRPTGCFVDGARTRKSSTQFPPLYKSWPSVTSDEDSKDACEWDNSDDNSSNNNNNNNNNNNSLNDSKINNSYSSNNSDDKNKNNDDYRNFKYNSCQPNNENNSGSSSNNHKNYNDSNYRDNNNSNYKNSDDPNKISITVGPMTIKTKTLTAARSAATKTTTATTRLETGITIATTIAATINLIPAATSAIAMSSLLLIPSLFEVEAKKPEHFYGIFYIMLWMNVISFSPDLTARD